MNHEKTKIEINNNFHNKAISRNIDIVVSLTSYPARINTVNKVIKSLLNQSFKPDKVILWLAPEQFNNNKQNLPKQLLELQNNGLSIEWYHDIKSYKKLIPALKKYPNSIIVTADDDLIYPTDWLQNLYKSYLTNPEHIHCYRAHRISLGKNKTILPYRQWIWNTNCKKASFNNFFTGVGGILYPPKCLYKDILREDLFMTLCPTNDDIWFWAMTVMNNKKIKLIKNNHLKLEFLEGSQNTEFCLYKKNVLENKNDEQLNNILQYYPQILNKIFSLNKRLESLILIKKNEIKNNFLKLKQALKNSIKKNN